MKILYEIVEQAMDGNMPTHEECYYGMLAYRALFTMEHNNLLKILMEDKERPQFIKKLMAENTHNTFKTALNKSPQEWLGQEHDPMTDECKKRRAISQKVFKKVLNEDLTGGDPQ